MNKPILEIKDLTIALPKNADRNFAVENADLDVFKGEILFIVGESGSGKSVMTSAILNDIPTSLKVTSGSIVFKNQDILKPKLEAKLLQWFMIMEWKKMEMIVSFQETFYLVNI